MLVTMLIQPLTLFKVQKPIASEDLPGDSSLVELLLFVEMGFRPYAAEYLLAIETQSRSILREAEGTYFPRNDLLDIFPETSCLSVSLHRACQGWPVRGKIVLFKRNSGRLIKSGVEWAKNSR